ncbi:MAG: hypothetical protein WCG01_01280 [bacterium]
MTKLLITQKIEYLFNNYKVADCDFQRVITIFNFIDYLNRETYTQKLIELYIDQFNDQEETTRSVLHADQLVASFNALFPLYLTIKNLISELGLKDSSQLIKEHVEFAINIPKIAEIFQLIDDQITVPGFALYANSLKSVYNYIFIKISNASAEEIANEKTIVKIDWSNFELRFLDHNEVMIKTLDHEFQSDFEQLGFSEIINNKKTATAAWNFLKQVALDGGHFSLNNTSANEKESLKAYKQAINNNLKNFFKAENDPIKFHKASGRYNFLITTKNNQT